MNGLSQLAYGLPLMGIQSVNPGPGLSGGCSIPPPLILIMFEPKIERKTSIAEATPCTLAPSENFV